MVKERFNIMQHNILRNSNITKIFLIYVHNGARKREVVTLRFMDNKECYFASPTPVKFDKPKRKIPAELNVFTSDGVYKTKVTLLDTNMSLREVLYEVSIPKSWDFVQLRASTRKLVQLPVTIKFNDGFTISATTYDLSLGGVSFFTKEQISSIYKKISGILTLELPKNTLINFPDGKMTVETKFVRERNDIEEHFDETLVIFKFIGVTQDDDIVLKNFLIKLD